MESNKFHDNRVPFMWRGVCVCARPFCHSWRHRRRVALRRKTMVPTALKVAAAGGRRRVCVRRAGRVDDDDDDGTVAGVYNGITSRRAVVGFSVYRRRRIAANVDRVRGRGRLRWIITVPPPPPPFHLFAWRHNHPRREAPFCFVSYEIIYIVIIITVQCNAAITLRRIITTIL